MLIQYFKQNSIVVLYTLLSEKYMEK